MLAEEQRSRPCRTLLPESVSNRTRQERYCTGRGPNFAFAIPTLKSSLDYNWPLWEGAVAGFGQSTSLASRYASSLQPMETANLQLTQIFDDKLPFRQPEREDFYDSTSLL